MTPRAIIDALIVAGTPAKLVVEVERLFKQLDVDNERRNRDRIRKKNQRSHPQMSADTSKKLDEMGTTALSADVRGRPRTSRNANEINDGVRGQVEIEHISKKESKKERIKKASAKTLLPEDFTFNQADLNAIRQAGWTPEKTETELMRFKDHALTHGRRCVDWHAAWRNWVRSPFQAKQPSGGMNGHHHETVADKCKRLAANMGAAMQSQAGSAGSDEGGEPNVISLPRQQGRLF